MKVGSPISTGFLSSAKTPMDYKELQNFVVALQQHKFG
jgi:hypothetical protein